MSIDTVSQKTNLPIRGTSIIFISQKAIYPKLKTLKKACRGKSTSSINTSMVLIFLFIYLDINYEGQQKIYQYVNFPN